MKTSKPRILAPAGDVDSFLAAIAAGADAVYCGLKIFSARMEASNFSMEELARLTTLARSKGVEVYVAFNSLIKESELEKISRILNKLARYVKPHALIIQDPAIISLAREQGYTGEFHLSTLANGSFSAGLSTVKAAGFSRTVLPRELSIDEIKAMAASAPQGLDLEVFIHGALCYAVSGRCYWSSWFGGKSGLRGRCVQPCRRQYRQHDTTKRFFSCLDFSADVLVKILKEVPEVTTWKIEGRKKGPHYVFYTVKAYSLLRDQGNDPQEKKRALGYLDYALGRPTTHYNILPQRPQKPLNSEAETGSGLFAGRVSGEKPPSFITREALLKGDLLRIGYEDGQGHAIQRVTRFVPKRGKLVLNRGKQGGIRKGDPVFIVDRRESEVSALIAGLMDELTAIPSPDVRPSQELLASSIKPHRLKSRGRRGNGSVRVTVQRQPGRPGRGEESGVWLSPDQARQMAPAVIRDQWWWLPPVVWPESEKVLQDAVDILLKKGAGKFVLNSPWQRSWFPKTRGLILWAGPFCNVANTRSLLFLKDLGFAGAFVSPELGMEDFLALGKASPIPVGAVLAGNWPLAVSRTISDDIRLNQPFQSPMGEASWVTCNNGDYWVFPGWRLDLTAKLRELESNGYSLFATLEEPLPKGMKLKQRQGLWNWNLRLL